MAFQIIFGLIFAVVGFFMVWKPQFFLDMLGEQVWMEKIFGPGRGTSGYKVLGVVVIIVGFLIITGLIKGILLWIFSPIVAGL